MNQAQNQQAHFFQNGGPMRQALGSAGSGDGEDQKFPANSFSSVFFAGHASGLDNESASGDSSPRSSSVCGTHDSRIVGICEHCPQSAPLCAICVAQHPSKHRVQPVGDLRLAVGELASESQILEWQCEKTGETIKRIIEGITTNATTAENEIRNAFDSHVSALEERRKELLKRVETVKSLKLSVLISQAENLQLKQSELRDAVKNAKSSMDNSEAEEPMLREVFDQLIACQMSGASGSLNTAADSNSNMLNVLMLACQVNEDDRLKFIAPQDGVLLNKVRQFGSIESGPCAKNSSIVGDSFKKLVFFL